MRAAGATALAVDAQRTLFFDRAALVAAADEAGIAIQAFAPAATTEPDAALKGIEKK
jgi:DUF1009 family protein